MQNVKYRPEIDGLRAIAVTAVILFHAGYYKIRGGYFGVDIFFVISGFLITGIISKDLEKNQFSIKKFYVRRARRIIPSLIVVMLVSIIFAFTCLLPGQFDSFLKSVIAAAVFSSNIYFWQTLNYFSPAAAETPLIHLWSLGVEEQYYILFPIILVSVARLSKTLLMPILAVLIIVSLGYAEIERRIDPLANFYLLPSRAWELMAGALLSRAPLHAWQQRALVANAMTLVGLTLIVGSVLFFTDATPSPSLYAIAPVAGSALVIGFSSSQNFSGRLLALWPLRMAGLVSYSAYLWHQPIIAFANLQTIVQLGPWIRPAEVVGSFLLAYLSWRYIEQPFRGSQLIKSPLNLSAITLVSTAGIAGILLLVIQDTPSLLPTYHRGMRVVGREVVAYADEGGRHSTCVGKLRSGFRINTCHIGVPGKTDDIVLWGDSYAQALSDGLDRAALARAISGTTYFETGCPPIVGLQKSSLPDCNTETHRIILDQILKEPGHPIVLLYGNIAFADHDPDITIDHRSVTISKEVASLIDTRDKLNAAGKWFVIVEQGPRFSKPVAEYYLHDRLRGGANELSVPIADRTAQENTLLKFATSANGYIQTTVFFCSQYTCNARDNSGRIIFHDSDHLTDFYSEKFANFLLDQLNAKIKN